jgi:hypothetical protein
LDLIFLRKLQEIFMAQLSFLSIARGKKKLRCEKFLDEMLQVVPWQMLVSEISPYDDPIPLDHFFYFLRLNFGLAKR